MEIWKDGIELVAKIYEITKSLPREEEYGLKSQIRRAAVSIPSNIAEGASRTSEREFRHFVEIAVGSSFEVETDILIAQRLNMISFEDSNLLIEAIRLQQRRMNSLVTTLRNSSHR